MDSAPTGVAPFKEYSAFNRAAKKATANSQQPAGGFIVEPGSNFGRPDEDIPFGGGFIPEGGGFIPGDHEDGGFILDSPAPGGDFCDGDNNSTHISLSMIPTALQYLDLPPDDEEVLAIFQNAATGWTSSGNGLTDSSRTKEDMLVSREDWRSVCSVLLEHDSGEADLEEEDIQMVAPEIESDDAPDSDEYHESEPEVDEVEDGNDDDYVEGPPTPANRRRTRRTARTSPSTSPSPPTSPDPRSRKPTHRQRQACISAYALFFPTIPVEDLVSQKIMIKDIQRVAKLLNEKLKSEDMVEMLEAFSTSPDKSMNFDDFCRMMLAAKLA